MRLVHSIDQLDDALSGARTEAENAFGSGDLLLEKALVGGGAVDEIVLENLRRAVDVSDAQDE